MGAAFGVTQAKNTGIALKGMHGPKQRRDALGHAFGRAAAYILQRLFGRIEGLGAIIGIQNPDLFHIVHHRPTRPKTLRLQAAISCRIVEASSPPVDSSRSCDTAPEGFATTPSAPSSRALAATGEPETATDDSMQIFARVRGRA